MRDHPRYRHQWRKRSVHDPDSIPGVVIIDAPIGTLLERRMMRGRHARGMHDAVAGANQSIAEVHALMPEKELSRATAYAGKIALPLPRYIRRSTIRRRHRA